MKISRRKFVKLGLLTPMVSVTPFAGIIASCDKNSLREKADGSLIEGFQTPPNTTRPFVRWWWNGNKLSEDEILRELDILKEAGIGGVEINSIEFPDMADSMGIPSLEWLSDDWIQMVETAVEGAKERRIICDIIVGSGWPFGGKFLKKKDQTQMLTLETKTIKGPKIYRFNRNDFLDSIDLNIGFKNEGLYKDLIFLRLVPASIKTFEPGIDLTDKLAKEVVEIEIPEGEHVLYYMVKYTGFQSVIRGAPGANGPVLNHYSKEAVERYLNRMSDALDPVVGGLENAFRAMFTDSLELEGANWTDDMLEEFEQRRGYSLYPYLPFVLYKVGHMGNPIDEEYGADLSSEVQQTINAVRYDFYKIRLELFEERFIDTLNDWCHEHGVQSRVQAYGRGYHPLEASMKVDIPECETWIWSEGSSPLWPYAGGDNAGLGEIRTAYSIINKFVSSGARLSGKRLVSCEEITNTEVVFNTTLENIKVVGDLSNLSGVTHSVLHGFNYSPKEASFPGWIRYGTFFNERNTWWHYFKNWTDYKARLSYVFQHADLYADIAVMHPLADLWLKHGPQRNPFPEVAMPSYQHKVWEAIHQNGNGCDYVSEKILQEASFDEGKLRYGDRSYKALILLEVESMQPDTARALEEYARVGGTIIFVEKTPRQSPGLTNKEQNDRFVANTIQRLRENFPRTTGVYPAPQDEHNIIAWYHSMQQEYKLTPYMELDSPSSSINQLYYRSEGKDIFFISNYNQDESLSLQITFNVEDKTPWLWDPEKGKRYLYPYETAKNELSLKLGPSESKLIVFDQEVNGEQWTVNEVEGKQSYSVTGPWSLRLDHVNDEHKSLTLDVLTDFKEIPALKSFAGTALYTNNFSVDSPDAYNFLDLGEVHDISEVVINGTSLGFRWYGQHLYELGDVLMSGENDIRIKVTTVLGNYAKSLTENEVVQKWTNNQDFQSAGLLGPVRLLS